MAATELRSEAWRTQRGVGARGYQLIELLGALPGRIRGAEVGVLDGRLSAFLLQQRPDLTLYLVDMWAVPYARYRDSEVGAARMTEASVAATKAQALASTQFAAARRVVLQGLSWEVAERVPDGSLAFVFLDADHTYEGVANDLAAWFPKVSCGGLFAGHDWGNERWGVTRAVREFAAELGVVRVHSGADGVWWMWK